MTKTHPAMTRFVVCGEALIDLVPLTAADDRFFASS